MVAMRGPIIAAPLAMPRSVTSFPAIVTSFRVDLGPRVGGHDRPGGRPESLRIGREPGDGLLESRLEPIHRELVPDDARGRDEDLLGADSRGALAARIAVRFAFANPSSPVAALAFPALTTTARISSAGSSSRHHFTGAAQIRLVVKVPAAAQGPSASEDRQVVARPRA